MTAINYVRDLPGGGIVTARVAPHPSSLVLPVASTPVVMGVWQHEELSVSVQAACRGSRGAIPPIDGGEAASCGGVVTKLQTRCVKVPKVGHRG